MYDSRNEKTNTKPKIPLLRRKRRRRKNNNGRSHSNMDLQSYSPIIPEERAWTGDVLEKEENGKQAFLVLISPACDFAQQKNRPIEHIRAINAIRINHEDLTQEMLKDELKAKLHVKTDTLEACIHAVFEDGKYLQKRFYVLNFLKDSTGKFFHLVLDFNRVSSIEYKETGLLIEQATGWKRLCRIESPFIYNLLQEYSAYASRIGVQGAPEDVIKKIIENSKTKKKD